MSKSKSSAQRKKRDKQYTGKDAAIKGEKVTKITAVKKSKFQEYWQDNKARLITSMIQLGLLLFISFVIWLILSWIF